MTNEPPKLVRNAEALREIKALFVRAQALLGAAEIADAEDTKGRINRNIERGIEWVDNYLATQAQDITPQEVALALIEVGDHQGWDRLTWTGDPDEYSAINDDVAPPQTVEFAKDLMRRFDFRRRS